MNTQDTKIPILLDTDIGSDIDDAACLAYLLAHPRCELLGITTVSGEAKKRAMLADAIFRAVGRDDIPIHSGCDNPILGEQHQPQAQQAEVLARWPHRTDFADNTAIDFLRETIRSRPGEITLLTIGPLTNIGLLFKIDPEIPSLLKYLVMMIGVFSSPLERIHRPTEWNAYLDPYAAAIVYGARGLANISVGLDVTTRCVLPAETCRERFQGGVLDLVREAAEVWFRQVPEITFHDPLAAACLFQPDILNYEDGQIEVEIESRRLFGATIWNPHATEKPHRVAVGVNPDAFFQEYFGILENLR